MRESYINPFLEIIEYEEEDSILTSGPAEGDEDWTTNEGGWDNNNGGGSDKEDEGFSGYY